MNRRPLQERNAITQALLGMERIHVNSLDSSHGLFGVVEKKYLIHKRQGKKLLKKLQKHYNILEIGGKTTFTYNDVYLDSLDYQIYNGHREKGNVHPFTIRTRFNSSNDHSNFQILHRTNNRKNVYHFAPNDQDVALAPESVNFFNGVYKSITGKDAYFLPIPVLDVSFKRIILYNKTINERVNIDYDICYKAFSPNSGSDNKSHFKQLCYKESLVIERKSFDTTSSFEKKLKKFDAKSLKEYSKYINGVLAVYNLPTSSPYSKSNKKLEKNELK